MAAGTVLVLVLVVVAILSVVAAGTMFMMRGELGAAAASERALQARAAAMSGIHRAMAAVLTAPADGSGYYDNPEIFQAQKITGDDGDEWYFTVYRESLTEPDTHAYGVQDESARININLATEEMLKKLPGMTDELVDCLLDYRDTDSDARAHGLEKDPAGDGGGYMIKNGPLSTPEELLVVKGFTGSIVYGEDANLNGVLEANEGDGDESHPPDDNDSTLNTGLRTLVTTVAYDPDLDSEGTPRININEGNTGELRAKLQEAGLDGTTADFIVSARQANVKFVDPSQLLGMTLEVPGPGGGGGGRGRGRGRGGNTKITISSGVDAGNLAVVMDRLTCGGAPLLGRVNINTAPAAVLAALPGLSEGAVQRIVDTRSHLDDERAGNTAWLHTDAGLSAEDFKIVAPKTTARGYQFRVRSFGYSTVHGTFSVIEAVIDLAAGEPRIVYLRELTRLGVPLSASEAKR
jgi:DNA uptake protein ComE-like DNA-binding protein